MEKYILDSQVKEFKIKLLMSDGQAFEDLFCNIMLAFNKDFKKVKAFGRRGDEKNDGFIPSEGQYYQCYGPEDISKKSTIYYAIQKLKEDFKGLHLKWNDSYKINNFYYVINDKYNGIPASIFKELSLLNDEFSGVEFDTLDAKGLENIFTDKLNLNQRRSIVGITPLEVATGMKNSIEKIKFDFTQDYEVWLNNINKIIYERIDKLEALRLENWYYKEDKYVIKALFIGQLKQLLKKQEPKEKDFLEFLEKENKSVYHLWNDFLENQKYIINRLSYNIMNLNEIGIFRNTGFDYQTYIDMCIVDIIKMFNEVVELNNKRFTSRELSTIELKYNKINKIINYDIEKKNKFLNCLLEDIIESKNCGRVLIFANEGEEIKLNENIQEYFDINFLQILNGDRWKGEEIVSYLTSVFESITQDGSKMFYPHITTNHIIFLYKFLNNNNKLEIEKLQKRSNIAVYYFEEND